MSTPAALKTAGQQASLFNLPEAAWAAFRRIIEAVPVGDRLAVNLVREAMDDAGIPPGVRGGLFSGAVKAGLLAPVVTEDGFEVRVKSNGLSAHHATCRLYVRTRP